MTITIELVQKVAGLARLALAPEEVALLTHQLDAILGYIEQLNELDTPEVEGSGITELPSCQMREDEERSSHAQEAILSQAPNRDGSFFIVPKIIE